MFESYYELNANPFRLSADESFRFAHKNYLKAWSYLSYALDQGEGFVMISGQPGCGKTTLIRDILSELDTSKILAINLVTNQLKAEELLRKVALEFGLPAETYNKATLLTRIEAYVEKQYEAGRRAIIVIDEAQNLTLNGLEELRLLSNLQSGNHPLFQIFLVGQDELRSLILSSEMEHIRQRLIASCQIETMTIAQTEDYIEHRLGIVGWHGDPAFDPSVFPLIHKLTSGIPRKINHVVSRLLLYGPLEEKHEFTLDDTWIVAKELFDEERLSINSGETFESFKAGYSDIDNQQIDSADELPLADEHPEPVMPDTTDVAESYDVPKKAVEQQAERTVSNEEPFDRAPTQIEEAQRQETHSEGSDLYLDEEDTHLFPESKTFSAEDEVDMLTTRIVNGNRTVADELVVEASGKTALGDGSTEEDDETVRNWQAYSETPGKASSDTDEILSLPSMQAERRKHEIDAMGGLINTEESIESDELFAGGFLRSTRNVALFVVVGVLILAIFVIPPEQVNKQWSVVNAKIQSMLTPKGAELPKLPTKGAELPIKDRDVPSLVTEEASPREDEIVPLDALENFGSEGLQVYPQPDNIEDTVEIVEDSVTSEVPKEIAETPEVNQTIQEQEGVPNGWEAEYIGEASKDYIATQSKYQQVTIDKPGLVGEEVGAGKKFQVFFEFNNTAIPAQFNDMLNDLFIVLSLNEQARLTISGYTDASGDPVYNMSLSLERAETVARYFTERGIEQARIQVEGHGPIPKDSNKAREALKKRFGNRRVELVLQDGLE